MDKEVLILLINKFLSHTSTPKEDELLYNYYQSFQKTNSDEWNEAALSPKSALKEKMLKRLVLSLKPETERKKRESVLIYFQPQMIAAAVLLFITAGLYFLRNDIYNWFNPIKINTIVTASKEIRRVQLPDKSIVWLEPETTLSYPSEFNNNTRDISLLGGAFFEVSKNPNWPFIIHTNNVTTKVLGTSFNEEAYTSSNVSVTVVTGRVVVTSHNSTNIEQISNKEVVLLPNQQVVYDSASQRFEKLNAPNAIDFIERREGKFIYKGEKLVKVINDIERIYNVSIDVNPEVNISNCTFYGTFDIRSDISTVLNIISVSLNSKIAKDIKNNHYFINGGGCF